MDKVTQQNFNASELIVIVENVSQPNKAGSYVGESYAAQLHPKGWVNGRFI